ncbi:MAG: ATP-binding protein, partial [Acidobacteriota bacterium]
MTTTFSAPSPVSWIEANQQCLAAEFERLKRRLSRDGDPDDDESRLGQSATRLSFGRLSDGATEGPVTTDAARAAMSAPPAIDQLADACGLSAFERDVLLLSAGVEMDAELAARCDSAGADARRPGLTFGLALAALQGAHWSALAPVGPLRRWRLVEVDDAAGLARGRVRIDERILHYLAGVNYLDVRLRSLVRVAAVPMTMADTHRTVRDLVHLALERGAAGEAPLVWLIGDDPMGQADVAADVASALGLSLHVLQAQDIPAGHAEVEALVTLWEREAMLLGSALLVSAGDESAGAAPDAVPGAARRFLERLRGLVFVSAGRAQAVDRHALRFAVDKPGAADQKQLWQGALGDSADGLGATLDAVASQFKLSARAIQAEAAELQATLPASNRPADILWSACRAIARSRLDDLAQRIDAAAEWDDLVLPDAQKDTLRQIGAHMRTRLKVHVAWGFGDKGTRGLGITALFAGESGTGKTMAAEVL